MQDSLVFEIQQILPDIILCLTGIIILVADPFTGSSRKPWLGGISLGGVLAAGISTISLIGNDGAYFSGMILVDNFSIFFRSIFLITAVLTILSCLSYQKVQGLNLSETYALILFATTGMNMMVASNELIMVFLGLETLSVSSYILLGIRRTERRSNEAALKYFLLGSFSSAFLLYGIALLYGGAKSTNIDRIADTLSTSSFDIRLIYFAAALLFVGLGFKVAAVPFHAWTPDVYEGAPAPIAAFMSAGPKAAGFAVLLRLFTTAIPVAVGKWSLIIWVIAVLTMTLGNVAAIVQTNIKRMLAYSSIAHAGYMLVALEAASEDGFAAILFYTLAYALMNLGAFAIVALWARDGESKLNINDYSGLGFKQPLMAFSLSLFLLSLAGIPLTAGFSGKFLIFRAALESRLVWLTVLGVLNSAVSVYYYLRVIVVMYMEDPPPEFVLVRVPPTVTILLGLSVFGILLLGVYPDFVMSLARNSVLAYRW
jgi:NADH-quinone oxidoreductase subunit N